MDIVRYTFKLPTHYFKSIGRKKNLVQLELDFGSTGRRRAGAKACQCNRCDHFGTIIYVRPVELLFYVDRTVVKKRRKTRFDDLLSFAGDLASALQTKL